MQLKSDKKKPMITHNQTSSYSSITRTLKLCKTTKQVHQLHCHVIITSLFSLLHPTASSLLLTSLLHSLLSLSPLSSHYTTSIFNTIQNPSTFTFNTIIRAHNLLSLPEKSLGFFRAMRRLSLLPDSHTFPFALSACAQMKSLNISNTLYCQSIKFGFLSDVYVVNCLIKAYLVLGRVFFACKVFDESPERDLVSYNTLIDGFVKSGETKRAREVFEKIPERDSVSWGTLIAGYAKMDEFREAILMFNEMIGLGVRADNIAIVSVLSACAQLGELEKGKYIHRYVEEKRIKIDAFLSTSLVDFYAKCGCIKTSVEIFESSPEKALFTWNAMLNGLAMHGHGLEMLDCFSKMEKYGIKPDGVTFLVIFVGCSHAGLVDEARHLFKEMENVYNVRRELKHYGCMADLLSRAGLITEAMEMIKGMSIKGDIYVWGGLLSGCRIHGEVEIAKKAADKVMEIKPEDGGVYSVLANVYANSERWDELTRIRRLRDCAKVKNKAGCSLVELNGVIHEFIAGDGLHPQSDDIYLVLDSIGKHQLE